MVVHPHRPFAEAVDLRKTHHLPKAQQTIVDLHHPRSHWQDRTIFAVVRWLVSSFQTVPLKVLQGDRSATDALLDRQSLGRGYTQG